MSSILYFLPHSSSCTLKFQLINKIYPPFSLSDSSCLLINSLKLPTEKTNQKKLSKIKSCSESQSKNLRTCKNCKTQFDPVHNHPLACRFHIAHFGGIALISDFYFPCAVPFYVFLIESFNFFCL